MNDANTGTTTLQQALMTHPTDCSCAACIKLTDIATEHRLDCKCAICLRWWEVMGPEPEDYL